MVQMGPKLLEVIQWSCHQVMQEVKGKLMVFLPPGIGGKSPATFFSVAWTWIVVHKHLACTLYIASIQISKQFLR